MLPDDLKECIRQLFIIMWATGTTYCLEESQTILLYKDKGDITDIKVQASGTAEHSVQTVDTAHHNSDGSDYAGPSAFTNKKARPSIEGGTM
jgi:hypothetical protein